MEFHSAAAFLQIVLFDLLLSGDNAVVIGLAARRLSPENRRRAIIIGGGGAVVLRVGFTLIATYLLDVPLLHAVGGVLLLWIAFKLLLPSSHADQVDEADSLGEAVRTIILADVVMSLDNILAISSAADGDGRLVVVGLILSIPLLLVASDFVSRLFTRVPILVYAGSVLLIWAAVRMFVEDHLVRRVVHPGTVAILVVTATFSAAVIYVTRRMADASISGMA